MREIQSGVVIQLHQLFLVYLFVLGVSTIIVSKNYPATFRILYLTDLKLFRRKYNGIRV